MSKTTIQQLADFGQSAWLDYISRKLLETGRLQKLIDSGLRGMTSNPTIFNQVISSSADYDEQIVKWHESGKSTFEIYDELTTRDVREAADIFRPVYEATNKLDGYVSLEINPQLAMKVAESIVEGKRLFAKVDRPNIMIKVPATEPGFLIVEELLSEGINVNVTLIFSLAQYQKTAKAFLKGMERLAHKKDNLNMTHSVASVFVSRIDSSIDKQLDEKMAQQQIDVATKAKWRALKGKAAVANSCLIFDEFNKIFSDKQFGALAQKNAKAQRVLWASTGTKNPEYSDIKYVTELISKPTVNTLPEKTLEAFLDHGAVTEALIGKTQECRQLVKTLGDLDIDINKVCEKLLTEGITAFEKSFDELLTAIENKARSLCVK